MIVKKALVEFIIVGAIGVGMGFCYNGLRASDFIELRKNYFDMGESVTDSPDKSHKKHKFQIIKFEEVSDAFHDGGIEDGTYLVVDARTDMWYQEGHIPGALQADHYKLDEYIEPVLDAAEMAEKIIVYCNGGDCDDSIFMCQDLKNFGVSTDRLFLYEGGWNEWESKGQPVASGSQPSASGSGSDEEE